MVNFQDLDLLLHVGVSFGDEYFPDQLCDGKLQIRTAGLNGVHPGKYRRWHSQVAYG
jgi:hypothetical protein